VGASIQEPFHPDAGDRVEVAMESWVSILWLHCHCANVEDAIQHGWPRDDRWHTDCEGKAVNLRMIQYMVYAGFGVCCTQCMLNSVYAAPGEY
jgi:hypothetical protein